MVLLAGRVLLVLACGALGAILAPTLGVGPLPGAALGAGAALLATAVEIAAGRAPLATVLWTLGGAAAGSLPGLALGIAVAPLAGKAGSAVGGGAALLGAWVGGVLVARRAGELPGAPAAPSSGAGRVLDTSVIIDGRITELAEAGFVDGPLIVAQFVVGELQRLADSPDAQRRNRGRRGFEILDRLRRNRAVPLEIVDADFPAITAVDGKLVALARARGARLLTNDAVLGRVAGLAGVAVASLNALAAAMRPVALPGESMHVQVLREGKEAGQGVAYLDDGTMVVVEGGKRFIGQPLDVVVTSALQTSAGRMIFTRPRGEDAGARDA
jgi:predicted nucleic acid-binding protein